MRMGDLKIGDAVSVPNYSGPRYEGVVVEFERYGLSKSVCVYINWDGDGVYVDYLPRNLKPMDWTKLTSSMRKEAVKLRQQEYLKGTA